MPDIWQSIVTAAQAMTWLEVVAILFSAACVFLAVKRNIWTYPIGIVGTIAFFFVFWNIGLYSSALLQIFFTAVQVYGWWFWLRGDKGKRPLISRVTGAWTIGGLTAAIVGSLGLSLVTGAFGAKVAMWDSLIFGLSVVAQFFLDRKKLENWLVWIGVNVISIGVYASQGLILTSLLYVVFLANAFYGYYEWWKEFRGYEKAKAPPAQAQPVVALAAAEGVAASMIGLAADTSAKPAPKRKRATKAKPKSITPTLATAPKPVRKASKPEA